MAVVNVEEIKKLYVGIAEALGAPSEEAEVWSNCMLRADLRGMYTQGAAMIPYSLWVIEEKLSNFGVSFEIWRDEPGLALVDRNYAVGAVAATHTMDLAMEKASAVSVSFL